MRSHGGRYNLLKPIEGAMQLQNLIHSVKKIFTKEPKSDAYQRGYTEPLSHANPFPQGSKEHDDWEEGRDDLDADIQRQTW